MLEKAVLPYGGVPQTENLEATIQEIIENLEQKGLRLQPKERGLFTLLLRSYPEVCTMEQIVRELWEGKDASYEAGYKNLRESNRVYTSILRHKHKLEEAGLSQTYRLINISGFGYALEIDTPEGKARIARLKETPLHEAGDAALLARILLLNDIKVPRYTAITLMALFRSGGHAVEKEQICQEVWGDSINRTGLLTQCIANLRKALGGKQINGFQYEIETHGGVGYSLNINHVAVVNVT